MYNLEQVIFSIIGVPSFFDRTAKKIETGVETGTPEESVVSYDPAHVRAYFDQMEQEMQSYRGTPVGIFAGRHERRMDIPVMARVINRQFRRNIFSVLSKKENLLFSILLTPLSTVYFDRDGASPNRSSALEEAVAKGKPYIGIFANGYTDPSSMQVKVGVAELSARYGIPVRPLGIDYSAGSARVVFGLPMPPLQREGLYWKQGNLERGNEHHETYNKAAMKEYTAQVLARTFHFFGKEVPGYVSRFLP